MIAKTETLVRSGSTLLVLVALCSAPWRPNPVCAQNDDETRADLATEADLRFELGVDAQRRGDYRTALEHYLHSQRLVSNKNVVFNIARCFEELDRFPEAFRYYLEYLDSDLDEAETRIAHAAIQRVSSNVALVRVEVDPEGASIYLDRRDLGARGRSPRTLAVEPGTHRILVDAAGYEPAESSDIVAAVGETNTVRIAMTPVLGAVRVTGDPEGAEIRADDPDAPIAAVLPGTVALTPGSHTLIVSAPGRQTTRYPVSVSPRAQTRLDLALPLETGQLVVDAEERGALIELDGRAMGFTPAVLSDVPSGTHELRVSRTGFRTFEDTVEIRPGARTSVDARLRWTQEITAASRAAESVEDAPASVSLISQEELHAFGYQTLWDAVGGQRGVYQSDDLTYASLGIRGFSQPTDYGNRILVTTDGHTMNDDQLGSSYVGYDVRADLMDVERIELVRGPGSALYGTNAFFGVLNVVTRDRDSLLPPHVSLATDADRMARARIGGGARISRDVGFWLSGAGVYSLGRDFHFPEFDPSGVVRDADGFHSQHAAGRGWAGDFTFQFSFNRRDKRVPSGAFDSILGDPRTHAVDTRGFAELRWEPRFGRELRLYVRAFGDLALYENAFAYQGENAGDPSFTVRDEWTGVWVGGEGRAVVTPVEWLRITGGAEVRGSALAELRSRYDAQAPYLDPPGSEGFLVVGGYLVAHVRPIREIAIDAGTRYDYVSTFTDGAFSPRVAVITRPWTDGVFKLLGGSAFRAPSPYELRYNDGGITQISPTSLLPERIWTGELEYSHRIADVTVVVSGFYNRIENSVFVDDVDPDGDGQFVLRYSNTADVTQTVGAEAEVRRDFGQGWMVAAMYSYQRTRVGDLGSDTPQARLTNSPEHMGALRGVAPLVGENVLNLAGRFRVQSPRIGRQILVDGSIRWVESEVPVLFDLILTGEVRALQLSWGAGVRNLFDWRYGYPGGEDLRQTFVPQPGRTFFVQTTISF